GPLCRGFFCRCARHSSAATPPNWKNCSWRRNKSAMLWEVDIYPSAGQSDRAGVSIAAQAADLGLAEKLQVSAAHGYLIQGQLDLEQIERIASELLVDSVVEHSVFAPVGDLRLREAPADLSSDQDRTIYNGSVMRLVHVLPKSGVTDPVA